MTKETKWTIDQVHSSEIEFKIRHLMISYVKGTFKIFDASIYTSDEDFTTAVIDLWIDVASINTEDTKRDEHLRSKDFFDAETHKQITFVSSTIGKADKNGHHELWGELTMKGITKNIKLNAQFGGVANDPVGNSKAGFSISGNLNRSEWEIGWNKSMEKGGFILGDEVAISFEVELTKVDQKKLIIEL